MKRKVAQTTVYSGWNAMQNTVLKIGAFILTIAIACMVLGYMRFVNGEESRIPITSRTG